LEDDVSRKPLGSVPLLRVKNLEKRYLRGGFMQQREITAVQGVDFEISSGQTLALLGESGSGKSTVARCVARLEKPDRGEIWIGDTDIASMSQESLIPWRNQVQMIFQDAVTAMNPRFTAGEVLEEPLVVARMEPESRRERARTLALSVGISEEWLGRGIMDFSGGQRQRLAIARALALKPELLILDEALTGLDLSAQAQMENLLKRLQAEHGLTFLLISHDAGSVFNMADTVAVMAAGRIVEIGPVARVLTNPDHEETIRLLAPAREAQASLAAAARAFA
jgi:peptide/nickel transport system ATP-binding protein